MRISGLWRLLCHPAATSRLMRLSRHRSGSDHEHLAAIVRERMARVERGEARTIPADEFLARRRARRAARLDMVGSHRS